jgi:DNA-binding transcriptional regulator YiaG
MATIDSRVAPVMLDEHHSLQRATWRGRSRLLLPSDITGMRRVAGLSMREFARRVGVSVETVSRWEASADVPTRANVGRLLDELMAAQRMHGEIRATVQRGRRSA